MIVETYRGKPCAHGHTVRYRSNRKCVACARLEVRWFEVLADGSCRQVTSTEAVYAHLSGRSYWRAIRHNS